MHLIRLAAVATFVALLTVPLAASAQKRGAKLITPKKDSPELVLLAGIKMIEAGNFDGWIDAHCHTEDLCFNANSKQSLRKYNLPALKRLAGKCHRTGGTALEITRKDAPATDGTVKIFVACDPRGMPRPFYLKKQGAAWKFKKI